MLLLRTICIGAQIIIKVAWQDPLRLLASHLYSLLKHLLSIAGNPIATRWKLSCHTACWIRMDSVHTSPFPLHWCKGKGSRIKTLTSIKWDEYMYVCTYVFVCVCMCLSPTSFFLHIHPRETCTALILSAINTLLWILSPDVTVLLRCKMLLCFFTCRWQIVHFLPLLPNGPHRL